MKKDIKKQEQSQQKRSFIDYKPSKTDATMTEFAKQKAVAVQENQKTQEQTAVLTALTTRTLDEEKSTIPVDPDMIYKPPFSPLVIKTFKLPTTTMPTEVFGTQAATTMAGNEVLENQEEAEAEVD